MYCYLRERSEETTFDEVNLVYIHVSASEMLHFVPLDKMIFCNSFLIDYTV